MKTIIFFCSLISTMAFGSFGNSEDEMTKCLLLSNKAEFCESVGCHSLTLTSSIDPTKTRNLCISIERMKECMELSNNIHKCQKNKCFYDFPRNFCYPQVIRVIPDEFLNLSSLKENE